MLKNARMMFEIVSNSYFKRYDLSKEWSQLSRQMHIFKSSIGREPFMYDLIVEIAII